MEFVKKFRSSRIKNSELKGLWESAGVVEHCKISNSKHQITNKFQIPILNDQNKKQVWNFETGDPPAGWGVQAKRGQFWSL
jgi:hypothetical protein